LKINLRVAKKRGIKVVADCKMHGGINLCSDLFVNVIELE